jgi:hypothetical protein
LRAQVDLLPDGKFTVARTKEGSELIKSQELTHIAEEIKQLTKDREKLVASNLGGSVMEKVNRFIADKNEGSTDLWFLQQILPCANLHSALLSKLRPRDLDGLLTSNRLIFSTKPLFGQVAFPFDPWDSFNNYFTTQSYFAQQAASQPLAGKLLLNDVRQYLPSKPVVPGTHHLWLTFTRAGYHLLTILNVVDPTNAFESGSILGGVLPSEGSAIKVVPVTVQASKDRVALSPKNLNHYAQRADTSWDMHGLQIDKSEFKFEPAAVLINPALADPLSFEVQEALEKWALRRGARGWVANCPDAVYQALSRSMIKGYVDLPSFDQLLVTDGQCKVEEDNGILTIQPSRPLLSNLNQVNRESLRRLVSSFPSGGKPTLSEVSEFALANNVCINTDLGCLLSRAVFDSADLNADAEGSSCDATDYALLGCIPENIRTRILDGLPTDVPASAIDPEKFYLAGGIMNFAARPVGEYTIADRAEGLMTPVNGGAMKISAWTDGGVPVVRRIRKTPWTIDQFSNAYEGSRVVTYPVGESIDRYWVPPSKVATLKNDDPHMKATMTDADVRERYFYRYGIQRILHLRITFPNGKISPVISYYKVEPLTDKPVTFGDLPEELKSAVLAGFQ